MSRLRDQSGFTVVEACVAAVLLAIAAVAVLSMFDASTRATYRAEQSQVASDIAQREIEALRAKPYAQLALTSTPTAVGDTGNPRNRVSGANFYLDEAKTNSAPMVINGGSLTGGGTVAGGTVAPGPTPFTSGDVKGTIQRYVVWRNDPNCQDLLCTGSQDFKRIIVAVTLNDVGSASGTPYVELQSDAVNPTDSVASNPNLPQLGTPTVAQQFWLSDERCQVTGEPTRRTSLTDHPVRTTFQAGLNTCAATNTSRPDALMTTPPLSNPTSNNGTVDFANDLEPNPPTADAGLQFLPPDANGCNLQPASTNSYKHQHVWVSRRLNGSGSYALTGGATLKLWTRTINDVATAGKLCVILFRRTETETSGTVTAVADATITSAQPSYPIWPSGAWEELTIQMPFTAVTIPAAATSGTINHQRLGLAIGLEKAGSPSDQIMINYDNVDLESRLEVETTTPIGG